MNDSALTEPLDFETLNSRIKEELKSGKTLAQIANLARVSIQTLKEWTEIKNPSGYRRSQFESIDQRLTSYFSEIDRTDLKTTFVEPNWVEMPTGRRIIDGLVTIRDRRTIGVIEGAPGVGKTKAIERYFAEIRAQEGLFPPVWRIISHSHCYTKTSILHAVAEQVFTDRAGKVNNDVIYKETVLKMQDTGGLLIVDEAQHMAMGDMKGLEAMNSLRHLQEMAGIGLAYLGSDEIYRRISGKGLAQLRSRVAYRPSKISKNTDADIDAVIDAWNVKGRKERELCLKIGTGAGGIRALVNLFYSAILVANAEERSINVDDILTAQFIMTGGA